MSTGYFSEVRQMAIYDGRWVSSRTDGRGRKDLGFDTENLACALCGKPRTDSAWINIETREVRCWACFTPDAETVELLRYQRYDGKVISRRTVLLR